MSPEPKDHPKGMTEATLQLRWDPKRMPGFGHLLQRGFLVPARVGTTVRSLVCDLCGIDQSYLEHRINTIFLDGKAVDDVDTATVRPGSILALSASMPGFVGAAFRKGGFYAVMRQGITHSETAADAGSDEGFIILRLFNLVLSELGPSLLTGGILLNGSELAEFFTERPPAFWTGCRQAVLNGIGLPCDSSELTASLRPHELVRLQVLPHDVLVHRA